ncbi:hypothetical protein GCM10007907_17540 [Chitinimonas prasina]|uniref:Uncharacterized protein n=1 Tax=Chitinimonas prasina TaxID=1434937 RepID=A0ABQ5YGB5_9NEIS|nr:hypothetical protein GCM10007907_17540 [Chitinimonas prasina]
MVMASPATTTRRKGHLAAAIGYTSSAAPTAGTCTACLPKSLFNVFSPRRSQPCRMKGKAQDAQRYGYRQRLATPHFAGKAANPQG